MINQISFVKNSKEYFAEEQCDYLIIYAYHKGEKLSSVAMASGEVE